MLKRKLKAAGNGLFVLGVVLMLALAAIPLSGQTDPGPVNVNDRESARTWFNTWWPRTRGAPMGFTGDVDAGVPGTTSQEYRNQILLRLNMYRRMAGVEPVTEDQDATKKAQAAAVLNAVNGQLSHNPPTSWKFYSALGAEGSAGSSLAGQIGPEGVLGLIEDPGSNNLAVGHRTALLEPQMTGAGIGNSPPAKLSGVLPDGAEAIYTQRLSSSPHNSELLLTWPRGYVPAFLIPGRWSVTLGDDLLDAVLDLSAASVAVTRSGSVVKVNSWRRSGGSGLIFTLDGTDEGNDGFVRTTINGEQIFGMPVEAADIQFRIEVSNIRVRGTGGLWNNTGAYSYEVVAYNPSIGSIVPARSSELINISTRSFAGAGSSTQIAGFIVGGAAPRKVLIRAGGPYLKQFGVVDPLSDPVLTLFEGQTNVATNDDWSQNGADILVAQQKAGAVPFEAGSKDAALVATLRPNTSYTAQVVGKGSATGNAIVEVYDVGSGADSRLINISTRSYVGTGSSIQIGGFILRGDGPRKVLIRAGGPYLSQFGVAGVLADPVLSIYKGQDAIATNDNWGTHSNEVGAAFIAAAAVPFAVGSKDAALVLTLDPEIPFTAQVSGKNGGTGNALIEIYALP